VDAEPGRRYEVEPLILCLQGCDEATESIFVGGAKSFERLVARSKPDKAAGGAEAEVMELKT
jgi:hypothetical protein